MCPESIKERIDTDKNNSIDVNEINNFIFDKKDGEKNLNDLWDYLSNWRSYETSWLRMTINNTFYNSQEWKNIKQDIQKKIDADERLSKKELSLIYLEMISTNFGARRSSNWQSKFEFNKPIDQICDWELIQFIREKYHAYTYTGEGWIDYKLPDKYTFWHNITETQKNTITDVLSWRDSPVTAEMVADSCRTNLNVPVEYLLWFMQNDSRVWTAWLWAKTHNPWNVWNTWEAKKDRWTREDWVAACAENLKKRIDAYMEAKKWNKQWFHNFPTPEELAKWVSDWWYQFFWIYMTASDWPSKVAGMVKKRRERLKSK